MQRPTCLACDRNTPGRQLAICYSCRDQTRTDLDQIAADYDEAIQPRATIPGQRRGSGHSRPEPMSDHAGSARHTAHELAALWLAAVDPTTARQAAQAAQRAGSIRPLTRALRTNEATLLARDDAGQYVADLHHAARRLDQAVLPTRRPASTIATCSCGGIVTARTITGQARCTSCSTTAPATTWAADDTLLTDHQAVRYLLLAHGKTITTGTLRTWRHRGQLPPATAHRGQQALTRRADLDHAAQPAHTADTISETASV